MPRYRWSMVRALPVIANSSESVDSDNHDPLSPWEQAAARHSAYALLGSLLLDGVTEDSADYVAALPQLPDPGNDFDRLAAAHHALFRNSLFPYESLFLTKDGLLGGISAETVQRSYQASGYVSTSEADHIGQQLHFMAYLSGAEADAHEDDRLDLVADIQHRQREFLSAHLLLWLAPCCVALAQQADRFYAEVGNLVWALVDDHAQMLAVDPALAAPLAPLPDLLSDEQTSLKHIARYLTTPVQSGWWLGQNELAGFGRNLDLPRGFGGRVQTLMNLFRSASQFQAGDSLLAQLQQAANQHISHYDALSSSASYVVVWRDRLQQTVALLAAMRSQLTAT